MDEGRIHFKGLRRRQTSTLSFLPTSTYGAANPNSYSIDKFLVSAGNSEQFDGNASVDKALRKLGLADLYQTLPGMEIPLMPHQVIGVAWMLSMEQGTNAGGTLGDEMGLGKVCTLIQKYDRY